MEVGNKDTKKRKVKQAKMWWWDEKAGISVEGSCAERKGLSRQRKGLKYLKERS